MSIDKTNAMRMLDKAGISYIAHTYECDGFTDGVTIARMLGQPEEKVYKTIVTAGASKTPLVFVVPVADEIDLKAAAKAAGEKSVVLLPLARLTEVTGYIRGGCSPIGMKKRYKTFIDTSAQNQQYILVSGGRRGLQLQLGPADLAAAAGAEFKAVAASGDAGRL